MQKISLFALILLVLAPPLFAAEADQPSGRDIMLKMEAADNFQDRALTGTMTVERGREKLVRRMEMFSKKYGEKKENGVPGDERSLIRFLEPADARGTMYLTWSWDDPAREDDMWTYMPAESLTRRISGSGKKGAFMRSDLANEDIQKRSVDADTHSLLRSENMGGADCWVVESVPKPELEEDTNYSKRVIFVRKDISLAGRVEYYDKRGRLLKTATNGGFQQIDGVWTITKSLYETPDRGTRTLLEREGIVYNQGMDDGMFQQSNLKR